MWVMLKLRDAVGLKFQSAPLSLLPFVQIVCVCVFGVKGENRSRRCLTSRRVGVRGYAPETERSVRSRLNSANDSWRVDET